jgi:hypothetical protein
MWAYYDLMGFCYIPPHRHGIWTQAARSLE